MKVKQLSLILFLSLTFQFSVFAQKIAKNRLKEISVYQENKHVKFTICFTDKKLPRSDAMCYWYADNKIHHNRGGYDGHLIHGEMRVFDENGRMIEKGRVNYGLRNGEWLTWNEGGDIIKITPYNKGLRQGVERYYENGQLIRKRKFRRDSQKGEDIVYKNGEKVKNNKKIKTDKKKGEKRLKFNVLKNKDDLKGGKERKKDKEKRDFFNWFKDIIKSDKEKKDPVS